MVTSPQVSWLFFKARAKCPYLIHTGRASNAEKQPTGRGPEGCVENGPAAALLVGYVSIEICSLLAPCRRPILNATTSPLFARRCTSGAPTLRQTASIRDHKPTMPVCVTVRYPPCRGIVRTIPESLKAIADLPNLADPSPHNALRVQQRYKASSSDPRRIGGSESRSMPSMIAD
jgi:hypothetical protein